MLQLAGRGAGAGFPFLLAAEVGAHVGRERAHGVDGVAQAGFGAVQGLAPVVYLDGGLDVDASRVGGSGRLKAFLVATNEWGEFRVIRCHMANTKFR
jgi:hypothetical protein